MLSLVEVNPAGMDVQFFSDHPARWLAALLAGCLAGAGLGVVGGRCFAIHRSGTLCLLDWFQRACRRTMWNRGPSGQGRNLRDRGNVLRAERLK